MNPKEKRQKGERKLAKLCASWGIQKESGGQLRGLTRQITGELGERRGSGLQLKLVPPLQR